MGDKCHEGFSNQITLVHMVSWAFPFLPHLFLDVCTNHGRHIRPNRQVRCLFGRDLLIFVKNSSLNAFVRSMNNLHSILGRLRCALQNASPLKGNRRDCSAEICTTRIWMRIFVEVVLASLDTPSWRKWMRKWSTPKQMSMRFNRVSTTNQKPTFLCCLTSKILLVSFRANKPLLTTSRKNWTNRLDRRLTWLRAGVAECKLPRKTFGQMWRSCMRRNRPMLVRLRRTGQPCRSANFHKWQTSLLCQQN